MSDPALRSIQPRRLRIAHVSLGLDVGGQEKLLVEFARLADRRRFELHFISLTTRGALAPAIEEHGWPVTTLEGQPGIRPGLIWALTRLFRRERFDVVHTHDDRPLLYSCLAVRLARVRHFIHTHHHGYLPQVSARQLRFMTYAARMTSRFVCVSEDSRRYVVAQGVPQAKTLVIRNGIDLTRFAFHGPQRDGPAVTVARLSPEKDIANLLRAVQIVRQRFPDFRLEIAGDGPERENLQRLVAELALQDAVRFLGEVREVPAVLARARLFVLPSKTEGISLTLLEAMASGLPVVATRVGGTPEVVAEEETGLLVPSQEPPPLADALGRLWSSSQAAAALGSAGRRRAQDHFDIRAAIAEYEQLCGCSAHAPSRAAERAGVKKP